MSWRNSISFYCRKFKSLHDFQRLKMGIHAVFSICVERMKGIDFSVIEPLPDSLIKAEPGKLVSYIYSPSTVIDEALKYITHKEDSAFLDIGCGKGKVLYIAKEKGFRRVAGIEINHRFIEIARKNFRKLHMDDVELFNCDARDFHRYGEFDVFYFFNPFSVEIQSEIIGRIISQRKLSTTGGKLTWLICYHSSATEYIYSTRVFRLQDTYFDNERGHCLTIWKSV